MLASPALYMVLKYSFKKFWVVRVLQKCIFCIKYDIPGSLLRFLFLHLVTAQQKGYLSRFQDNCFILLTSVLLQHPRTASTPASPGPWGKEGVLVLGKSLICILWWERALKRAISPEPGHSLITPFISLTIWRNGLSFFLQRHYG